MSRSVAALKGIRQPPEIIAQEPCRDQEVEYESIDASECFNSAVDFVVMSTLIS